MSRFSRLFFVLFFGFAFSSSAISQTPGPDTPGSIEKMFEEELQIVRGIRKEPQSEREHKSLIEALIDRLEIGDANQRYEAGVLLEKEVNKSDIPILVDALKNHSSNFEFQLPVIRALGATKDPSILDPMRYEFNQGDVQVQLAVIDAIAQVPDDFVANMLQDILTTGDSIDVHIRAAAALGKIGGDRARYVLGSVADRYKDGPERRAIAWSRRVISGEISEKRTDVDIDEGRQQNYYYKGMMYYAYRPAFRKDAPKDTWLIVCVHGKELNLEEVVDLCQPLAKQMKASLLVPFFDPINFPEFDKFNLRGIRSDRRFFEIIDHLGNRADIKTREVYLLGFGTGGDFSQRITYFYPDRIARAAFTSSFFYPLQVDKYFPDGLKTTPLAPDLKVDLLKVTKTDFAFILDPYQGATKEYKGFLNSLIDYTSKSQHSTRIRMRQLQEKNNSIGDVFNLGKAFLFPRE